MAEKFVFLTDLHWGYERRGGHKVPLHDTKALSVALQFIDDFRPDHVILGGDMLDCGAVSHHNTHKAGAVEGLRLLADAAELRDVLLKPLEQLKPTTLTYIEGNHEDWLNQLVEEIPGLGGIVSLQSILKLNKQWKLVPRGEAHKLGKLVFVHGDQLSGGEHIAKAATLTYEKNIRFGHFHSFQVYTKTSAIESNGHTGVCVPCLCKKAPGYGKGAPNKWAQGFLWGYVDKGGFFNDYVSVIVDGKAIINGVTYRG